MSKLNISSSAAVRKILDSINFLLKPRMASGFIGMIYLLADSYNDKFIKYQINSKSAMSIDVHSTVYGENRSQKTVFLIKKGAVILFTILTILDRIIREGPKSSQMVEFCVSGPSDSGTKNTVAIGTLAAKDKIFGKEVVSRCKKIMPKLKMPSVEKVSQPTFLPRTYREE